VVKKPHSVAVYGIGTKLVSAAHERKPCLIYELTA